MELLNHRNTTKTNEMTSHLYNPASTIWYGAK